jgi:hypothetical protein
MTRPRVALAFLTKDKTNLSERTITSLLDLPNVDLFIVDGSETPEGKAFVGTIGTRPPSTVGFRVYQHPGITGGPDAAVAYAITTMLKGSDYEYVGLVEQDVLMPLDWLDRVLALFKRGAEEGLTVGAASARCYEDRILIQRDGYAVLHNAGYGQVIWTREAARLALTHFRTGFTTENRRAFCQLSGIDIGTFWAFRGMEHPICSDWTLDRTLASYGLATLALTPSPVEMIGQTPPLAEQGLTIAKGPVDALRNDAAFDNYSMALAAIRRREWAVPSSSLTQYDPGTSTFTYFPHRLAHIGASYEGDWRLKWTQGFGPFSWKASDGTRTLPPALSIPTLTVPLSGPVEFLVTGGPDGGQWQLEDKHSGYTVKPKLPPESSNNGQLMSLPVPTAVSYRDVILTALTPGVTFYGLRTREPQPWLLDAPGFDWHYLPRV